MMGRGAEGGCGAEGNSCRIQKLRIGARDSCGKNSFGQISDVKSSSSKKLVERRNSRNEQEVKMKMRVDVFTQALKALAVKNPFETEDDTPTGSLPASVSQFSGKYSGGSDGRRKHRKIQGRGQDGITSGKIGSATQNRDSKHSKIWVDMEEYFREVTAEDVVPLIPTTQINVFDASEIWDPCLLIPPFGIYYREAQHAGADVKLEGADVKMHRKDLEPGKTEIQEDRADVKEDSQDAAPECTIDGQDKATGAQVRVDVGQDEADGPGSSIMAPKQESSSYERIAVVMPQEQESNSVLKHAAIGPPEQESVQNLAAAVLPEHESSSCLNLAAAVSLKQESSSGTKLGLAVPCMPKLNSDVKLAAVASFPMQISGSGASLAAVVSHEQESISSTKLASVAFPKKESRPGVKLTALASSPKQESRSDAKLAAVALSPKRELISGAKLTEEVYPKQETSSTGKLAEISSPEQELSSDSKVSSELLSFKQEPNSETSCPAQTSYDQEPGSIVEITGAVSFPKKEPGSVGKLTAVAPTKQESSSGAKRKLLAASLRSKKKKISETPAGVITTVISPPENGDEELCHVCYGGDSEEWNQILFCDSCDVAVHQGCYGVREIPDGQWLCSWCSYKSFYLRKSSHKPVSNSVGHQPSNDGEGSEAHPCILCPRRGGALKPVARMTLERENQGNVQFAHLFCCQWVPETYIENMETMEPIKNSEGIREARWKLLCSLCKEKHGACIQCSHGMCATAFHPLCAREAKLRMGISSKEGSDDVDLWAFCSKHSLARVGRASSSRNGSADGPSEVTPCLDKVISHFSNETCTGQESQPSHIESGYQSKHIQMVLKEIEDRGTSDQGVFLGNCKGVESNVSDLDSVVQPSYTVTGFGSSEKTSIENRMQVKSGDVFESVDLAVESFSVPEKGNVDAGGAIHSSESKESIGAVEAGNFCNLLENLRKAVEKGQLILTDVAVQMGVSSNLLTSLIKGRKYKISAGLKRRISAWICSDNFTSTGIHESESATEHENSLAIKTSDPEDLIRDTVQTGRSSKRTKNKRRLLKATHSNRGHTFVETSSFFKERAERDVAVGELSSHRKECHDNELDMCMQNVQDGDRNQLGVEIAAVETMDNTRVMQNNSVLKDLELHSLKSGAAVDISPEAGSGTFDEEMQQKENQQQAGSEVTKQKHPPASILTKTEDVPAGIGGSDVEKDSNAKHASLNIQAATVLDCKELGHFGLPETACIDKVLKGCSIGEDPDAKLGRSNAWSNFDGSRADNHAMDLLSTDKLIGYIDIECVRKASESYVHPLIEKRLVELQHGLASTKGDQGIQFDDQWESDVADGESRFCGTEDVQQETDPISIASNLAAVSKDSQLKQLIEARNAGVLDLVPEDELEGEILFLQNKLLEYVQANRCHCENLILRVITNLSEEKQASQRQRWDAVLVSHYLGQAREAKKQGRKERRHKEAQAFLAAATAAAAASSRIGSSRKDGLVDATEEHGPNQVSFPSKPSLHVDWSISKAGFSSVFPTSQPMKVSLQKPLKGSIAIGRPGSSSQTMLRAKETLSRPIVAKLSSERQFDAGHLLSGSPKEDYLPCDICKLQESTRSNRVHVCRHCKVAVHQDCYGISRVTFGGWYCQPCEELHWQYQGMRLPAVLSRGRPGCDVECALCGGLAGAFKRSTDGQWVHVFCAEWMLENTFRKGQVEPVGGLETVSRERYLLTCSICHRHQGACLKCNFGHCHNAFHPLCARDSGLYMSESTHGGKVQHKAYCERHSPEQRAKESRRYGGSEELKIIKQMRVELERVRLICERIVRREKLKRELLHCSHSILASKRDCVAFSAVFHSSFLPPDISSHTDIASGSAAISLRGSGDENKAWRHHSTGILQRLDEYSVESTASGQLRESLPSQSELYHATSALDDVVQHGKISAGSSIFGGESVRSGKSLAYPIKSGAADDRDDEYKRPKKSRKHAETLQREVVMTPTEASVQNQRLPKGYAYVPVVYLAKGKPTTQDVEPQNP